MGQSSSVHAVQVIKAQALPLNFNNFLNAGDDDLISKLPDDCLGLIFQSLSSGDRKSCSLVSRRWFVIEARSREKLNLKAQSDLLSVIPGLFYRFDSITNLTLRFNRTKDSLDDEALSLIARKCRRLDRINLRGCRAVTEIGMAALGMHAKGLKKFSCGSCTFGVQGMNALLDNCTSLEVLSVKRLHGIKNSGGKMIGPGVAASLEAIRLKELHNGQCFSSLIVGSKKLRSLKLLQCSGDWDNVVEMVARRENSCLSEVHFDKVQVSDVGLSALSYCLELESLHIIKTVDCTNFGIISVLEKCSLLRKLHIDGWRTNQIGDQGLVSIGKHGANLEELVLMGVNPSLISIEAIASGCKKLERLAICGSKTVADAELCCIATKCEALKKLCIKSCPISDKGIEAFAPGCPNLMKIKVKKCVAVTSGAEALLRLNKRSIIINIDVCELQVEAVDANASDAAGTQEDEAELLPMANQDVDTDNSSEASSSRKGRAKRRFGLFRGKCYVARACKKWLNRASS
ncbi:putative F-box/LRR-repeat protein 8 [Apium graveolens]|uniref:putative F-box/LRR-repeat protein 8 n=1 Tax=Apium graveolens TaxID=4045 RepID=UPI003D798C81